MAILDWPTTEGFQPMRPVLVGASSPKSTFIGAYSGERTESSRSSDRLVMEMTLPTTTAAIGRKRAAWLKSLASTGNHVRMPVWPQRYRQGTMSGSPTVSATVAAGVRSVALAGVLSAPNLLLSGTALGAASWVTSGATISSDAHTDPTGAVTADRVTASTGTNDYVYQAVGLTVGRTYTFSVYLANFTSTQSRIMVRKLSTSAEATLAWSGSTATGVTLVTGASANFSAGSGSYYRVWVTFAAGESDAWVRIYPATTATHYVAAWGVQIEEGASPSTYASAPTALAGDFVGIGGNLLEVGPTDCTGTEAGALTLGLALPIPRGITSGAVVTTTNATGVWQLDEINAPMFGYEAGPMQGPVSLVFRQVAQ